MKKEQKTQIEPRAASQFSVKISYFSKQLHARMLTVHTVLVLTHKFNNQEVVIRKKTNPTAKKYY